MNEYYNETNFPEYVELLKTQPVVPGQNFEPVIFHNIFSEEELDYVRKQFETHADNEIDVQAPFGLGTLRINLLNQEQLIAKIERLASDAVGEELEVLEFSGTRYSTKFGWYPKLGPHADNRPVEMFVFDYHVQSDEDWGLFVEGKKFNFYDNDAIIFSGTGQIHWREQMQLKENSNVDLLFFWMQHKNPKTVTKEHAEIMKKRSSFITERINPMPSLHQSDWWKPVQVSQNAFSDFVKISTNYENSFTHNSLYRDIMNNKDIEDFYSNNSISKNTKDNVTNIMTHIHPEANLTFKDVKLITHSGNAYMEKLNYENEKIVSLLINLRSNENFKVVVDAKELTLPLGHALSLSPTRQSFDIKFANNLDPAAELLLINFNIEKK